MPDEIQLPLADGGTCIVRRECLIISMVSSTHLWQDCLGEFLGASLLFALILFGDQVGIPMEKIIDILWILAFLIVCFLIVKHRNRFKSDTGESRISRQELVSLLWAATQLNLVYQQSDSKIQRSLSFSEPATAQQAFKSLGWEPLQ